MSWTGLTGLAIALAGPVIPVKKAMQALDPLTQHLLAQAYLLVLVAIILVISHSMGLPAEALYWRGVTIAGIATGLILAGVLMWVVYPVTMAMFRALRLQGYDRGLEALSKLPRWSLVFAAIVAGIAEETLYRGFALTRIAEMTGSVALAVVVTTVIFAVVHQRLWGWAASLGFIVSGLVLSIVFVWRQDLFANIIAHAVTDAVGLWRLSATMRKA